MIDHALEDQVRDELHRQAQRVVVPPPDPHAAATDRHEFAIAPSGWRPRMVLAVAMALAAVALGAAAMFRSPQETVTTDATSGGGSRYRFDTEVGVQLEADRFSVDTGGQRFSPTGDQVEVHGDPGVPPGADGPGYTTLELTWFEHGVEMRVNLYFTSDATDWWANEVRTYNGADPGEWITMTGEYFRSPLGEPFVGELDAGPLQLEGIRLTAFAPRSSSCDGSGPVGGLVLEVGGPRPVEGVSTPTGGSGYATWFDVLDASTCTPVEPEGVFYEAVTGNLDVAVVGPSDPFLDSSLGTGRLRIEVQFTGPGETNLTVKAVETETGSVLSMLSIPVAVEEP